MLLFNVPRNNCAFQIPVDQDLNHPQPEMRYRIISGINYAFN